MGRGPIAFESPNVRFSSKMNKGAVADCAAVKGGNIPADWRDGNGSSEFAAARFRLVLGVLAGSRTRCFQHPRFGRSEGQQGCCALRVETEGEIDVNGLLLEELPEVGTGAARAAGEACALDNYLIEPDDSMDARIAAAREKLAGEAIILGHHYQRDEVIRFADFTGDSYKLSKAAAESKAKYMIFCGVHFMAETADVLAQPWQQVILPDLNAGCSMADMAEIGQVEDCWEALERQGLGTRDQGSAGALPGILFLFPNNRGSKLNG